MIKQLLSLFVIAATPLFAQTSDFNIEENQSNEIVEKGCKCKFASSKWLYTYVENEQSLDNGDAVVWEPILVLEPSSSSSIEEIGGGIIVNPLDNTAIIIPRDGYYRLTYVIVNNGATTPTQFTVTNNGTNIAGSTYYKSITGETQLIGQVIFEAERNNLIRLVNTSQVTVTLTDSGLTGENVTASILIERIDLIEKN